MPTVTLIEWADVGFDRKPKVCHVGLRETTWRKKIRGGLVRRLKEAKRTHEEAVFNPHKTKDIPHYGRTTGAAHHYALASRYANIFSCVPSLMIAFQE